MSLDAFLRENVARHGGTFFSDVVVAHGNGINVCYRGRPVPADHALQRHDAQACWGALREKKLHIYHGRLRVYEMSRDKVGALNILLCADHIMNGMPRPDHLQPPSMDA
jgi:hypothetical protein